jgi:hypothetical protein
MITGTILFFILGLPMIFLGISFFLLCLNFIRSRENRTKTGELLALAQKMNENLNLMETRLTVLEDIILEIREEK